MRRCPACHALYPDADRFCETDGETLVPERDKVLSAVPTLPVAAPPADVPIVSGPRLMGVASALEVARIPELIDEVVAVARRFEHAKLAWQPQPEDFLMVDGHVALGSARGVFRLASEFDVRPALRALGEALLDAPVALCSTTVVRLLSDPSLPSLSIRDALAMVHDTEQLVPDLTPSGAAVLAHIGYKRPVQQDAVRAQSGDGWTMLALCDGVSGSIDGGLAARVGSATACDKGCELLRSKESLDSVVRESVLAAHRAVLVAAAIPRRVSSRPPGPLSADRTRESPVPTQDPPGATIVVAAIRGTDVAIAWAGDSRAYVIADVPDLVTVDHSWGNAMLATGHVSEEEAFAQPLAHALTRCIGPLDDLGEELVPDVRTRTLAPGSTLVLCSDGVWAYLAKPATMAAMVRRAPRDGAQIARALVHQALLRGGHDNASVAVYVVP